MNSPAVSIIIPNYNGGREPLDCIDSIYKLIYPLRKIAILVIDNHSTDDSVKRIRDAFPQVKIVALSQNQGFTSAVNQGIQLTSAPYIFITNDDVEFEPSSLKNMIDYYESHPDVGVIGGKIFSKKNRQQIVSSGYYMNMWSGNVSSRIDPGALKVPDWVQGCALCINRTVINKIGLFDPGFTHFFEDYDFCLRARRAGFQVIYLPTAQFWHGESTSANKNKAQKHYAWYRNKLRFILIHYPFLNCASVMCLQLLYMPVRLILRDGRFMPFLKGLSWNIINLPETLSIRYAT